MTQAIDIAFLGRVDYGAAWDLQKELVAARTADERLRDTLLLLEHPPTYTLGRHGDESNLIFDADERAARGITLYHVDRGGDVTYHGPGQLVGYPILNLTRRYGRGIGRTRRYVSDLETVLLRTLGRFGIRARRHEGFRGVWVEQAGELRKIAAIGVYVNHAGISSHGFALNVHTDLGHFEGIIPCGIADHGVTSVSRLLGSEVLAEQVLEPLAVEFRRTFGYDQQSEGNKHVHHQAR